MVRAAASGAIDYSRADPKDIYWRIRHRLVIRELQRQNDKELFNAVQQHWLSYVAHGRLSEESFTDVKKHADTALLNLQKAIYPWIEVKKADESPEGQKDTINPETRKLLDRYKQMREKMRKKREEEEQQGRP